MNTFEDARKEANRLKRARTRQSIEEGHAHSVQTSGYVRLHGHALWLLPSEIDRLGRCAETLGCSRSELIRSALRYAAFNHG